MGGYAGSAVGIRVCVTSQCLRLTHRANPVLTLYQDGLLAGMPTRGQTATGSLPPGPKSCGAIGVCAALGGSDCQILPPPRRPRAAGSARGRLPLAVCPRVPNRLLGKG